MIKKLNAIDRHVIIRPIEREDRTKSGIITPRGEGSSKILAYGEVVSVGQSKENKEAGLKEGDKIIYQGFKRDRFLVNDEYLEIVRIDQIFATYEEEGGQE